MQDVVGAEPWGEGTGSVACAAADLYDLDVASLTLVAEAWNATFRVDAADGAAFALRLYREPGRSDREILAEHAWLASLAETDLHVPRPIRSRLGRSMERVRMPGGVEYRAAVFTWVPGLQLGDEPTHSVVADVGEGIGRLHAHGRSFPVSEGLRKAGADQLSVVLDVHDLDLVSAADRAVFERALRAVEDAVSRLERAGEEPHIVHGDIHQENVFVDGGQIWFIDFDDCLLAWPVHDLGVTMWEVGEDQAAWAYRDALREGYERVAPWPEAWPGAIDTFAAARGLLKVGDVVGRRGSHDEAEIRPSVHEHAEAIAWFLHRAEAQLR